jgi:hypothetical protein
MLTSKAIFFMNLLPEKKYGVPSHNFVKKNVLCEKGDEINRFDGTSNMPLTALESRKIHFFFYIMIKISYNFSFRKYCIVTEES